MNRHNIVAAAIVLAALADLGGCEPSSKAEGPADTFGLDFSLPKGSRTGGTIIFCIDGVNARIFQELLDAGELPAFQKYFVDRGLYCPRTVAAVPSITLPCFTSIVTGVLPGHHGILGNRWFDRNQLFFRDYATIAQKDLLDVDYKAPTIYEQFPDELTFSAFLQPHRGATKFIENWATAGPPFFLKKYQYVDCLTLCRFDIINDLARQYRRFPAVTTVYQLAVDFAAYDHGPDGPEYRAAIRAVDRRTGQVLGDLQRAGLLEKTIIAMVSDHGHSAVHRHLEMAKFLANDLGLQLASRMVGEKTPFEDRLAYFRGVQAAGFVNGDKYFSLYLRACRDRREIECLTCQPWLAHPAAADLHAYPTGLGTMDLPAVLVRQDAVDAVAFRTGPASACVCRKGGQVEFTRRGEGISYRLMSGTDPLGYTGKAPSKLLQGEPASGRQWLAATIDTEYPDLPEQILTYFQSERAGDLVLFAATDWDFLGENHSGHGSVDREVMLVPMMLAGPGVPHEKLNGVRSVDLMPTILQLLGKPLPANLDGRSLLPQ